MKLAFKNKKGVAIMLVLSAIVLLTTMGVEFAYNTNVNHHLAQNERNRLQAYYLAKSAYNFMLLELKFEKTFRQVVQNQNLGQYLGANAQLPLCQQFPLSTGLIRAVFTGGGVPGLGGTGGDAGGDAGTEAGAKTDQEVEEMRKDTSISQEKNAQEFLNFEGDFDGECFDEGTKINLNGFFGLATTSTVEGQLSPYDQYRLFLVRFLSDKRFEDLFDKADVRVQDVVTNIGDWIDTNTEVNEAEGRIKGVEQAIYDKKGLKYPIHNGKLLTLLEAYLIDGVVDDWFAPTMDMFTVYGDGKINICTASEDILQGLIRRYVDATPNLPPLRLEDPEEMGRLVKSITDVCAAGVTGDELKSQASAALNSAIGSISSGETVVTPPKPSGPGNQPAQGTTNAGFGAYIDTDRRFFSLKFTGQVQDTMVRIKAVMDVKETDPKKWKLLYWRVY